MADPAELIHDLIYKYGRWLDTGKHNVDSPQRREFYEARDRLKAALTPPQPSAEDAAVLTKYDEAVANWENSEAAADIRRTHESMLEARAAVLARMAGKVPDGWRLVPVEPTEAMFNAVIDLGGRA